MKRTDAGRSAQLDLFAHVVDAYTSVDAGTLTNTDLYKDVARRAGLDSRELEDRTPIGRSGQRHSLLKRSIRWHQQTLKHLGVISRLDSERGVWALADRTATGLHRARPGVKLVAFSTRLGVAVWGACESVFDGLDQPIVLIAGSPPYPLRRSRAYGNPSEQEFTDFMCRALEPAIRHLAPGASVCLNLGNEIFLQGSPARSMYRERLVLALADRFGLQRMDTLIWLNKSRPPAPVQWASKHRVQLNASWEPIEWLSNDPSRVRADNRRVLEAHTERHLALMHGGGEKRGGTFADGAYALAPGAFGRVTEGRIPRNVLERGHKCADSDRYRADARRIGLPVHGAMQPLSIPDFLVRFLSEQDDLVVDPWGGSVTTGMAAERNRRRWIVSEIMLDYLRGAAERFRECEGFEMDETIARWRPGSPTL